MIVDNNHFVDQVPRKVGKNPANRLCLVAGRNDHRDAHLASITKSESLAACAPETNPLPRSSRWRWKGKPGREPAAPRSNRCPILKPTGWPRTQKRRAPQGV